MISIYIIDAQAHQIIGIFKKVSLGFPRILNTYPFESSENLHVILHLFKINTVVYFLRVPLSNLARSHETDHTSSPLLVETFLCVCRSALFPSRTTGRVAVELAS